MYRENDHSLKDLKDLQQENNDLKWRLKDAESDLKRIRKIRHIIKKPVIIIIAVFLGLFVYSMIGAATYRYGTANCNENLPSHKGGCGRDYIVAGIVWPVGLPVILANKIILD